MGRALYSTIFAQTAPVVREEPEPQPNDVPTYATWSYKNMFDPDSDEFFLDAEYEAFIPMEPPVATAVEEEDRLEIPSEAASPMAMGDDPSTYSSRQPIPWRFVGTAVERSPAETPVSAAPAAQGEEMLQDDATTTTGRMLLNRANANLVQPGTPLRNDESPMMDAPSSVPAVDAPPASVPIPIPRTASPDTESDSSSLPPSTPPQASYSWGSVGTPGQHISVSMSPPPSISPRLYTWARGRHTGSPGSPATTRGGPLTNPTARASFPRIVAASPALRV